MFKDDHYIECLENVIRAHHLVIDFHTVILTNLGFLDI